jgi:hypothetical protein
MPLQPDGSFHIRIKTWFDQTDALGILHHSHYVLLIERAQKTFFVETMGVDTIDPKVAPDVYGWCATSICITTRRLFRSAKSMSFCV